MKLIAVALVAAAGVLLALSMPEIKRYLKVRNM
jgi:hypothetical protein